MKKILLSAGIIISLGAAAQNTDLVENYLNHQLKPKAELPGTRDCYNPKAVFTDIMPSQWGITLNGEKVYRLPQDGMACIVPDMKQFNMPNAGEGILLKKYGAGVIPNPGAESNNSSTPRGQVTIFPKKAR